MLTSETYVKVASRLLGLMPVSNSNQPRTVAYSYMSRWAIDITTMITITDIIINMVK